jgi:hypothetical protein
MAKGIEVDELTREVVVVGRWCGEKMKIVGWKVQEPTPTFEIDF